jgi:hypothetical protein
MPTNNRPQPSTVEDCGLLHRSSTIALTKNGDASPESCNYLYKRTRNRNFKSLRLSIRPSTHRSFVCSVGAMELGKIPGMNI